MEFVSEPITPKRGTFDIGAMVQGLPGLPSAFVWRGREYTILRCLGVEKVSAREGHTPRGEAYLRRHVFEVELDSGERAQIYCLRQAPTRQRWFLYTIGLTGESDPTDGFDRPDGVDPADEPGNRYS